MIRIILLITMLLMLFSSCGQEGRRGRQISVCIEPLRFIAAQIAGDDFEIRTIVPKGSSPESYDPTPKDLMAIAGSDAVFLAGGLGFEVQWKDRLMEHAPHSEFVDCSVNISRIENEEDHHGHHHGRWDPHTWTTPANCIEIARQITATLSKLDKERKDVYEQRLKDFSQKADSLDRLIHSRLDSISQRSFAIYHPSLTYFAKEYNLEQISIESEGKEPSAQDLKRTIDLCRGKNVDVIFLQQEFDQRNATLISSETGARVVTINPLSFDLWQEMTAITKALADE